MKGLMIRHPDNSGIYKTVVILWISLSIASVILAIANWTQLHRRLKTFTDAVAIVDASDAIQKALLDIETGQRGFALTGDESFLEPFKNAEKALPRQFNDFAGLVSQNPTDLQRMMELHAQSDNLVNFSAAVIAARREQGLDAAIALVQKGEGKKIMDDIRGRIEAIKSLRYSLVSPEGRSSQNQLLRASLTSLIAGAVGIGAGLFAFYLTRVSLRQQQRERELLEAKLRAEHENLEKSTFLANMSHEIRTPMNAILGFSELLSSEVRDPRHRQYLQSIHASAISLLQLINDILDMSKVEAGALELRPEPTNPREICEFIVTVFSEAAHKKNIKLQCKVADDLPRALLLDRVRLRQILVNLVGNAIKFTDQGHIYTNVTWEKQEPDNSRIILVIEVQDTGVGIPRDKLDAIFKPFVQAGLHHDRERSGTGLGLAIVQRLTQLMGGTVAVASVPGQGSAFHLRFPDVAVSTRLPVSDNTDAESAVDFNALCPAKILIVDDNQQNCNLVAGMFMGSHHKLAFGADGREAVEKAKSFRPDILLIDVRMPNMNGHEALDLLRKTPELQMLPVIAVSASNLSEKQKDLEEEFSGYLRKPFTRRELFNELAQFLPRRESGETLPDAPSPAALNSRGVRGSMIELVTKLRALEAADWRNVRDSGAVNETRSFADKLEKLGRDTDSKELRAYAEALAHYADTYTVDALEKHLQQFPSLIERIEHSGQ
jgi:signal transduction histidine kinase/CheY-like chemotaxis protein